MKKLFIYTLVSAFTISLVSCSAINRNSKTQTGAESTVTSSTTSKSSNSKNTKSNTLPADRQEIIQKKNPQTYTSEEFQNGIVKGDWAIETVFGEEAVGEKAPFIKFNISDGRIYGNNGCNTINAKYNYDPKKKTLTFDEVAVTMMLCNKEGITDIAVNRALNETRKYSLEKNTAGYMLTLYNSAGDAVMTLSLQNFEFLNGTWKIVALDGEEVNIEKMKLVFDVDEHKVHGNTGCNVLNGRLETDMDAPNSISFEGIAVTMMLCPEMEYQTAMLVALEETCRAKPISRNRVDFIDTNGRVVMSLERTSDK